MEPDRVPRSFGCFPPKGLILRLHSFRSKSFTSSSTPNSPRSPKSPLLTPKRNTREQEFRQVFRYFDGDNDGKISALELRSYFASIGEYMSHEEAQAVIIDLDTDEDNLIDFGDFMRLMDKEGEAEDVKAAFEMFEVEKGSGRINPKSLQRVLSKLGDSRSYDECVDMIRVIDKHGKGAVDFNEFREMMMA